MEKTPLFADAVARVDGAHRLVEGRRLPAWSDPRLLRVFLGCWISSQGFQYLGKALSRRLLVRHFYFVTFVHLVAFLSLAA